ncbi:methyl-accepting chemotaxis protein PctC [mine drainage metagenome]|uniref:Methyl-accepting chemotaxis protein PctC n=1 Tax=mine drainage metagenome TaxID=410659 RepID=A0A1J5TF21_9ZZZZ
MRSISLLKTLTLQQQLRLMMGISVFGMVTVIAFVMINLNQLRQEFHTSQTMQLMDKSLIEIKATALAISRGDPILGETATQLDQADAHIRDLLQRVDDASPQPDLHEQLTTISKQWDAYVQGFRNAIKIATTSPNDALQIPDAMYGMYLAPMVQQLDKLATVNKAAESESEHRIEAVMSKVLWVVLLPLVALGIITVVAETLFGRNLRKRLEDIVGEINHLHNGDLSRRLTAYNNDEISHLSSTINNFIARFETILHEVHVSANQTHKTAHGVSQMAHSVTANAKEQSAKVFQVSDAIDAMGNTIKKIATNAANASSAAKQTLTLVQSGGETGKSTILALGQIDQTVSSSVKTMNELNHAIQRIGSVSSMIKEIAEQTNLLALNAAIEAARAGEQGRGFAVVADEVRKLAERTTSATSDITKIVQLIESETDQATKAMTLAKQEVAQGVLHGENMGQLLHRIEESVLIVTEMMRQIASSTEDQSAAGENISLNINSVATISASTATDIEQARNEMLSLANASKALFETLGQFKLARAAA